MSCAVMVYVYGESIENARMTRALREVVEARAERNVCAVKPWLRFVRALF